MEERKIQLSFNPKLHRYTDETGLVYTSVTTVIGQYKEPFNTRYWSMYTTLKNAGFKVRPDSACEGIWVNNKFRSLDSLYKNPVSSYEVETLVKKWEVMTKAACDRGNVVHDFLEDNINLSKDDDEGTTNDIIKPILSISNSLNTGLDLVVLKTQHDLDKTGIEAKYPVIYKRLKDYITIGCVLFAEKKIYSTTYQIAGMIDVLIVNLHTKRFAILDWKTNKDVMMFKSGYFKKVKVGNEFIKGDEYVMTGKTLLYPLNDVEDCKGMIYTLQLSLYAYIMELWGYKLVEQGLEIFHIRPNLEPKLIVVDYKKEQIHRMLQHYYKTKVLKIQDIKKNSINFGITK